MTDFNIQYCRIYKALVFSFSVCNCTRMKLEYFPFHDFTEPHLFCSYRFSYESERQYYTSRMKFIFSLEIQSWIIGSELAVSIFWLCTRKYSEIIHYTIYYTKAEIHLPPFLRNFQMHFPERKCINFGCDFTEICAQGSNQQYSSSDSDKGMAPVRRQFIVWTKDGRSTDTTCVTRPQW